MISPRTKKIVMNNSHDVANKNHLILKANQVNGRSVGDLDGVTDYMSGTITGFKSFTSLFILDVFRSTAAAAADTNSVALWGFGNPGSASGPYPANRGIYLGGTTSALSGEKIVAIAESAAFQFGRLGSSSYARAANTAQSLALACNSSGTTMAVNNSAVSLNLAQTISASTNITPSSIGYTVDDVLHLGAFRSSGNMVISPAMQICERIVCNAIPTTAQLAALQSYVAAKWGIA
jgi:hypothetical protein